LALGAPRARVALQTVMESVALFLPAGLIGALSAVQMPMRAWIDLLGAPEIDMSPDVRVVFIVLAVALAAALLAGSTPALDAARTDLTGALKDESGAGGRRRLRLQSILLVLQVAVSVTLLIIGGMYFRSVRYVWLHRNFDSANLYMAVLDFNIDGATNGQRLGLAYALTERVRALPSVQEVTIAEGIPNTQWIWANKRIRRTPFSQPSDAADLRVKSNFIGRNYLNVLGIPLLKGTDFSPSEIAGGRSVAIVTQSLANRLWPAGDAIGKMIYEQCAAGDQHCQAEVIGIAADSAVNTVSEPLLYRPLEQHFASPLVLAYRTAQPEEVSRSLRTILSELNPNVLVIEGGSADAARYRVMLDQYVGVWSAGILGLFAVILTSLGIYGVASYGAQSRLREIGIRTALGARPHAVVRLIIRRSVILTAIGLAIGCIGGLAAVRVMPQDFGFYGIGPFDWPAYAAALFTVFTISIVACYFPSLRAARRDPLAVLRHE
jgi:predicted permease